MQTSDDRKAAEQKDRKRRSRIFFGFIFFVQIQTCSSIDKQMSANANNITECEEVANGKTN